MQSITLDGNNHNNSHYIKYCISDTLVDSASNRDVGVIFDVHLNFEEHTHGNVNRATKYIGILHNSFLYLYEQMYIIIYHASHFRILLGHLESFNKQTIYKHRKCTNIKQRRATRLLQI